MEAENRMISLLKPSQGGGGGGTDDYTDFINKPKINSVTLSGNKTSSQLGLQDALVSGTNIKTVNNNSLLGSGNVDIPLDEPYTTLTGSTAALVNKNVYGQIIPSGGVTYTLPTVTAGIDNYCKLFLDTTNSATVGFSGTTPNPNGVTDMQTGHRYIVICQYDNLKSVWSIFIIDCGSVS